MNLGLESNTILCSNCCPINQFRHDDDVPVLWFCLGAVLTCCWCSCVVVMVKRAKALKLPTLCHEALYHPPALSASASYSSLSPCDMLAHTEGLCAANDDRFDNNLPVFIPVSQTANAHKAPTGIFDSFLASEILFFWLIRSLNEWASVENKSRKEISLLPCRRLATND